MSTPLSDYDDAPEIAGKIVFRDNWYLLEMPEEFHELQLEHVKVITTNIEPVKNPHISVMKNETPSRKKKHWGRKFIGEEVTAKYSSIIRNDNGFHFWIDCYSAALCQMREYFGLPTLKLEDGAYRVNFHMTIAQRMAPVEPTPRPRWRLTEQSHIDIETGMQHL